MHFKVSGFYRLEVRRPDGRVRQSAEFPNLVTDAGLNRMGNNGDYLQFCQVGTGSTAPSVADTALAARVAGSSSLLSATSGTQASSPYYAWRLKTFIFPEGSATGNLAEVGVGWATSGSLFSRALILDSGGSPTTITVLSDETLYVTYEFRIYPPLFDSTEEVIFTGSLGGAYNYTWRASNVTNGGAWNLGASVNGVPMGASPSASARSGTIGAITAAPGGSASALGITAQTYIESSLERRFNVTASLSEGNISGIRSIYFILGPTAHQVQFDPAIPKTASDTLALVVSHSWGRV